MHILLAEDNPINQQVVRRMIQRMDHTVRVVECGEAAIEAVETTQFDAVLMDMMMPNMSGIDATREIRERGHDVHIIALTANAGSRDRQECLLAGMNDFLSKPFSMEELRGILSHVPTGPLRAEPAAPDVAVLHEGTLHTFLACIGPDPAFLLELFRDYLADANRARSAVHAALDEGNADTIRRSMHTLKANSAIFGATALEDVCHAMEDDAKRNDLDAVRSRISVYEEALSEVIVDVEALVRFQESVLDEA